MEAFMDRTSFAASLWTLSNAVFTSCDRVWKTYRSTTEFPNAFQEALLATRIQCVVMQSCCERARLNPYPIRVQKLVEEAEDKLRELMSQALNMIKKYDPKAAGYSDRIQ